MAIALHVSPRLAKQARGWSIGAVRAALAWVCFCLAVLAPQYLSDWPPAALLGGSLLLVAAGFGWLLWAAQAVPE